MAGAGSPSVHQAEIAVYQAGTGRDVVVVHGFQNDHSAWDPFVDRLDLQHIRVTALDLVGCGSSSGASAWTRCTIDEYVHDVIAVFDALGLVAPIAIGHSLGGAIVLDAALTHPSHLSGAVLVAPASTSGLDFLPDEAAFDALAHPTPDQQRALAIAAFRHPPPDDDLAALMGVIARATPEHIEGAARSMRDFTRQADLPRLEVRTLLVCGDRDRHVPLPTTWRRSKASPVAVFRCTTTSATCRSSRSPTASPPTSRGSWRPRSAVAGNVVAFVTESARHWHNLVTKASSGSVRRSGYAHRDRRPPPLRTPIGPSQRVTAPGGEPPPSGRTGGGSPR